jgi:hypothetical protein
MGKGHDFFIHEWHEWHEKKERREKIYICFLDFNFQLMAYPAQLL